MTKNAAMCNNPKKTNQKALMGQINLESIAILMDLIVPLKDVNADSILAMF